MTSGVFFHLLASAARSADAIYFEVLFHEFAPSFGHGVRVHAEELGNPLIAAVAEFEGFQSGVETPLFFIKHAEEQHDGRLYFLRHLVGGDRAGCKMWVGLKHSPGQKLALAQDRLDRTIHIQAADRLACHPLLLYQLQQGFLGPGV
jgi:hypothetical protein